MARKNPGKPTLSKVLDGAKGLKIEHTPLYIFIRGILGCVFFR